MKRVAALLLVGAAACSLYGEDAPDSPSSPPSSDSTKDGGVQHLDASDERAVNLDNVGNDAAPDDAPVEAGTAPSAPLGDLYVFVTSKKITGKLMFGQPELVADKLCHDLAIDNIKLANRKFVAWIGVNHLPEERIVSKAAGRRYLDVTGQLIANDPASMTSKGLLQRISYNELGIPEPLVDHAWTGIGNDGKMASATCNLWGTADNGSLGLAGAIGSPGTAWTSYVVDRCDTLNHLYCFEVP